MFVVTDTFDTWRIRTNEVNTTLNQATQMLKLQIQSFFVMIVQTMLQTLRHLTLSLLHTEQLQVQLQLLLVSQQMQLRSIYTTGGIRTGAASLFESSLQITTNLQVDNNSRLVHLHLTILLLMLHYQVTLFLLQTIQVI